MLATTIEEVIEQLEVIITDAKRTSDPKGYFAALYRKVTIAVRDKIIEGNYFEDNVRMEKLDVIFANRYLEAYDIFMTVGTPSLSWLRSFTADSKYWPIVLQHLLLGMNAHINLDLGIAAAQISNPEVIEDLKGDFTKINELLSGLVNEVQQDLTSIYGDPCYSF